MSHIQCLSYNIHKGRTIGNVMEVISHIRDALRLVSPDLVLLQEIMGQDSRSKVLPGSWGQLEYLADEMWPHSAYGKNSAYEEGDHGNAILSRIPIVNHINENISNHAWEQRGLLHATIEPQGEAPIHIITLHLDLLHWGRTRQLTRIIDRITSFIRPEERIILGGDFNDWNQKMTKPLTEKCGLTECFETLRGKPAKTFPALLPALCLDRVYVRGFKPLKAQVLSGEPWNTLSDHAALLVELESI